MQNLAFFSETTKNEKSSKRGFGQAPGRLELEARDKLELDIFRPVTALKKPIIRRVD